MSTHSKTADGGRTVAAKSDCGKKKKKSHAPKAVVLCPAAKNHGQYVSGQPKTAKARRAAAKRLCGKKIHHRRLSSTATPALRGTAGAPGQVGKKKHNNSSTVTPAVRGKAGAPGQLKKKH